MNYKWIVSWMAKGTVAKTQPRVGHLRVVAKSEYEAVEECLTRIGFVNPNFKNSPNVGILSVVKGPKVSEPANEI